MENSHRGAVSGAGRGERWHLLTAGTAASKVGDLILESIDRGGCRQAFLSAAVRRRLAAGRFSRRGSLSVLIKT